jgi:hypothetical protein
MSGKESANTLEARLSAYETNATGNSWASRLGSWPIYAAAAGAALAHSTSASASIIFSGPQNLSTTFRSTTIFGAKTFKATVNMAPGQGFSGCQISLL